MSMVNSLGSALAWLGRQGTRAIAVSVVLSLAFPQLAPFAKPFIGELVYVLLLFSFLRVDTSALRQVPARPLVAATVWVMLVTPLLFGSVIWLSGVRDIDAGLYLILILQVVTPPITSAAAIAALIGLDVALSLAGLIVCSFLAPITTPLLSSLFIGSDVISPLSLGLKLLAFFATAALAAAAIRAVAGQERIVAAKDHLDGLNVLGLFVFVIAVMGDVPRHVMAEPVRSGLLLALTFAVAIAYLALSALVFWRLGRERAIAIGLLSSNRNLGVIIAVMGNALPDVAWFYFALVQFPIYLMPDLLKWVARRQPA